ncbi:MAG: hypothetical protein Pg6C_07400 [Treponemataceae bacterium]|jgi:hypothetical protein|nr:MAG: hypothetical protein Pg6C_07400 [Treponemataceae bacterium]
MFVYLFGSTLATIIVLTAIGWALSKFGGKKN